MSNGDLLGRRFGMLTVMEDSGQRKGNSVLWRCRCDCGGEILAKRHQLVCGALQSCGCAPKAPRPGGCTPNLARPGGCSANLVRPGGCSPNLARSGGCSPNLARPKGADLIGKKFGHLTVVEDSGLRSSEGVIRWRCKCDCGRETLATRRQLVSGNTTSCGCLPKQYASKRQVEDLRGRQFGELTVLHRAENDKNGNVCWYCRCSCGKEVVVRALQLKSGKTRSCGCKRHGAAHNRYDLTGQRFGRLTATYRLGKEERPKGSYWHCRCDCGNELDVCTGSLLRGLTQSCGCWNLEQSRKMHEHMHYQDDTCIEVLKNACADTGRNKAGFRGLFQMNNGKYRASITFRGKHYNLGHYDSFDEAVQARLEAEEALHIGYVNAFAQYEKKAKADPDWAEANSFYYEVTRNDRTFHIRTNGI